uniref:Uncharacterized protein n=1 Tax=Ditylenchus dipsaci TaxID=166011 RepID=A0A915EGP2_9BILA
MWDTHFDQTNLRGCPDWNCEISSDHSLLEKADASGVPVNSNPMVGSPIGFFNMSLGFRHDTLASSPYGYTVKLALPHEEI